jgi:signal recognition particle subunit SRP54
MFENLSERLGQAAARLRGKGRLSDDNIKDALRQVRMALLEADVAVPVVKTFIDGVRARALGEEVKRSLTPGQTFIKIVHSELVAVMGGDAGSLNLRAQPPAVIMMAGLQGSGKTTSSAKLARRLIERDKKKVMLASADIYRPAAIQQLEQLAGQVGAEFFPTDPKAPAAKIAADAREQARKRLVDVLIVDTAGRLHVDDEMMAEAKAVHEACEPIETLFVVDAMTGQDAVRAAEAFAAALPLTGIVLTKADGDARGGAALSVRQVTGQPVKFVGVGEKSDALEVFHPERIASRILGMGDVVSLVEQVEEQVDKDKAERLAKKLRKGKGLDMADLREQLSQMLEMGGLEAILDKLPGNMAPPGGLPGGFDDRQIRRQIAIINSMTPKERRFPKIIDSSRKRRIAAGSGVHAHDVNRLLKQFTQMQKVMKKASKGGLKRMMQGMPGMPRGFGR